MTDPLRRAARLLAGWRARPAMLAVSLGVAVAVVGLLLTACFGSSGGQPGASPTGHGGGWG